jgi:hypothetical protein
MKIKNQRKLRQSSLEINQKTLKIQFINTLTKLEVVTEGGVLRKSLTKNSTQLGMLNAFSSLMRLGRGRIL